mmetsp:Transcript_11071/g.41303  ORF Transcript_11071/g.41303 Transcript_11071/m.41303 type:complete len:692 (+) Transcript_11071:2150-4225(+)
MHSLLILSFFILTLSAAVTAHQNTHIVRFKNKHARDVYLNALARDCPSQPSIELLNGVFVGAIISHDSQHSFEQEHRNLNRLHILSTDPNSDVDLIEAFEQDAEFQISQSRVTQTDAPWHLDRIDQDALPLTTTFDHLENDRGDPVNVYVVDTGIRISHQEFQGRARAAFSSQQGLPAGDDCNSHGTHVAALVAGHISGVNKNAIVHDVRVMDCTGRGSNSDIIRGLDWIANNAQKPALINLSLGGGLSESIDAATMGLIKKGLLPVIAAGNEVTDACTKSPARVSEALTVGASTNKDIRAPFSNFGTCVDIFAPGFQISSASHDSDNGFVTMSGTSMSSPIVAGVASLHLAQFGDLTPAQLKAKVLKDAVKSVDTIISPLVKVPLEFTCPKNFGGINCTTPLCGNKLATHAEVCMGRGECISPNACQCDEGYVGTNCENFQCFGHAHEGDAQVCSGHGACVAVDQCECLAGYSGKECEIAPPTTCFSRDAHDSRVCSGHGDCVSNDHCACMSEYSGEDCSSFSCFGKSAYSTRACSGNGFCSSANNCTCHEGFNGFDCESRLDSTDGILVAVISGAPAVVQHSEENITFSGESSFDRATNDNQGLEFEWSCTELRTDSRKSNRCVEIGGRGPELHIDMTQMDILKGGQFEIRLTVTKGESKSQASALFAVLGEECEGEDTCDDELCIATQ